MKTTQIDTATLKQSNIMNKRLKTRKIYDGITILENRYLKNDPEMAQLVDKNLQKLQIGQKLYKLRTKAELTQKQLGDKIGTSASCVSRVETANYNGDIQKILKTATMALNKRANITKINTTNKAINKKPNITKINTTNKPQTRQIKAL